MGNLTPSPREPGTSSPHRALSSIPDRATVALVVLASFVMAVVLWCWYGVHWQQLWTDLIHDRSAHLDFGVQPASDLRSGHAVDLLRDLNAFRSWPPLHDGVLVGLVMLVSGLNPKFAVLPSLAAFAGTPLLALLVTRRLAPRWGNVGGAFAATLVLASPAFRAFATDVMIEGPAAFFVLLVLYAAVRVQQEPTPRAWRWLALSLTALFLTKYNYWLIAMVACAPLVWPLRSQRRHRWSSSPQTLVLGGLVASLLAVAAWNGFLGPTAIWTSTVAAWIMLVAGLWWSRSSGKALVTAEPAMTMLFRWHALPVVLWLCLPGKFQALLWFLSPFSNSGGNASSNPAGGFGYYLNASVRDYHTSSWMAVVVGALVLGALLAARRGLVRRGVLVLFLMIGLALVLTIPHPIRLSRLLHPVMPVVWVAAGVGMASLIDIAGRRRPWPALAAATALVLSQMPALGAAPHAPEGGVQTNRRTALALTDAYLPRLSASANPAIVSNIPLRFLARWTYQVRYRRAIRPVTEIPGYDESHVTPRNAAALDRWLATGAVDTLALVDVRRPSPWYVMAPATDGLGQLIDLVHQQRVFVETWHRDVGEGATVEIWTRRP